ncbi:FAD-dependent oxidoreductase [Vibrio pacinii]|uniref:FAD-dependent oxidoreductase n=1 Tax=Vibrio pacinii TaxID=170674 RepID=UPI00056EF3DB|nr:FAD-dependent oxidoreductase [Vibrio pacinii]
MKICVVGAGWYGCHVALSLLQKGVKVDVFERSDRSISGASRYNQNRLHQGFHYPRDYETRKQSLEGFDWFIEHYGNLVATVSNNIYGIADKVSNVDFETYKQIMTASHLVYDDLVSSDIKSKFRNVSGMINTTEKLILNHQASRYFDDVLSGHITYKKFVDLSDDEIVLDLKDKYDFIIDCTWGCARKIPEFDYYYEPCIYFYYKKKIKVEFSMTLMDGEFFSIYPYDGDIYTLTSVRNTPISKTYDKNCVGELFQSAKQESYITRKRELFEEEVKSYYPEFLDDFEYLEPVFSLKTKLVSGTDYRGCMIAREGQLISIFSGKIDTLHIAEQEIMKVIFGE